MTVVAVVVVAGVAVVERSIACSGVSGLSERVKRDFRHVPGGVRYCEELMEGEVVAVVHEGVCRPAVSANR